MGGDMTDKAVGLRIFVKMTEFCGGISLIEIEQQIILKIIFIEFIGALCRLGPVPHLVSRSCATVYHAWI